MNIHECVSCADDVNKHGDVQVKRLDINSIQFKALFRVDINHTYNTSSNDLLKSTSTQDWQPHSYIHRYYTLFISHLDFPILKIESLESVISLYWYNFCNIPT
jgi:hypothetical protein